MASRRLNEVRLLLVTQSRDPATHVEQIVISPPLVIENLTVFPLHYCFPDTASPLAGGVVPALSRKLFYQAVDQGDLSVAFSLPDFQVWSPPTRLAKLSRAQLKIYRQPRDRPAQKHRGPGGDFLKMGAVTLNVVAENRLAGKVARTLCVSTQFLFINNSDLPIYVKQPDSLEALRLEPRGKAPFSWGNTGSKHIMCNVSGGLYTFHYFSNYFFLFFSIIIRKY